MHMAIRFRSGVRLLGLLRVCLQGRRGLKEWEDPGKVKVVFLGMNDLRNLLSTFMSYQSCRPQNFLLRRFVVATGWHKLDRSL